VAQATTGESVEANKALLRNNAQLAACFARAYYS
jgi:pseudouridine-5'-phosphate glycosidase